MAGTMDELLKQLNYDYNVLLFEVRAHMKNLNLENRRIVEAWIEKLSTTNQSLEEIRLRNDFLFFLSRNCEDGTLQSPFDQRPSAGYELNLSNLPVGTNTFTYYTI